jgi:hypothetical protein
LSPAAAAGRQPVATTAYDKNGEKVVADDKTTDGSAKVFSIAAAAMPTMLLVAKKS